MNGFAAGFAERAVIRAVSGLRTLAGKQCVHVGGRLGGCTIHNSSVLRFGKDQKRRQTISHHVRFGNVENYTRLPFGAQRRYSWRQCESPKGEKKEDMKHGNEYDGAADARPNATD
jgi:hypothetical protein